MQPVNPTWRRHDAHRFIRHDAHRFLTPAGIAEERRAAEAERAAQRAATEIDAAALEALRADHERIRIELADVTFELAWRGMCRKYGYNPGQPRDERGRWTDAAGAATAGNSESDRATDDQDADVVRATGDETREPQNRVRLAGDPLPPLQRIHPDTTYERDPEARRSLNYWRGQPTDDIVKSLKPGAEEPLIAHPDGRVKDGNTRLKVLQERGYNINSLPRTLQRGGGALPGLWPWQ